MVGTVITRVKWRKRSCNYHICRITGNGGRRHPGEAEPRFSPGLWQTEGPTTRSGSPGVTEGEFAQQGGELQAELSGKDKKIHRKMGVKTETFFLRGQEP